MATVTSTITSRNKSNNKVSFVENDDTRPIGSLPRTQTLHPTFTVADLRRSIPAHCFEHSLLKSFGYLFLDLTMAGLLYLGSTYINKMFEPQVYGASLSFLIRHLLWSCYWFAQGVVFTGLWVIGHECGHGGFASNGLINDFVGFIVHSALIVPYFAWKISHRRHHANTGSLEHDEVFVPSIVSSEEQKKFHKKIYDEDHSDSYFFQLQCFFVRVLNIIIMLTFGWASYLIMNATSNKSYDPSVRVNHFEPSSPIFKGPEKILILLGDLGLIAQFSLLAYLSYHYTFLHILYSYLVPYVINVGFLVLITFLQHTDPSLPHYDQKHWNWLSGALLTVDRDFGILNFFHHHIADTHICHHIFASLPHYHAQEATEALKKFLGPYYQYDNTPILTALYRSFKNCNAVSQDKNQAGVYWF